MNRKKCYFRVPKDPKRKENQPPNPSLKSQTITVPDFSRKVGNMMGDYIWSLIRKSSLNNKKVTKNLHF